MLGRGARKMVSLREMYLGELEEGLGKGLDVLEFPNSVDATLDGVGVTSARRVEDRLDFLLARGENTFVVKGGT